MENYGSRLPGRGGLSAMGDDSRDASELREVLHEVRGECEAKSAELDARQGDLQLVRRALHAANSELSTYRQRTATMRALLGQAVREQCKAQIKHSQAIATAPRAHPLGARSCSALRSPLGVQKTCGEGRCHCRKSSLPHSFQPSLCPHPFPSA